MPNQRLDFIPGINREFTSYANEGGWYDSQCIRFRAGKPEKLLGWRQKAGGTLTGICRFIHVWRGLDDSIYTAYGTHSKMYVEAAGVLSDVTPIRETQALTNPFGTTLGSTTVTVTDTGHGAGDGDYVTFSGAVDVGGIPAASLNIEFEVSLVDSDTYEITVDTAATSTATGGGASVSAEYQMNVGHADQIYAYGFGAGTFGASFWGTARTSASVTLNPRTWTGGNWGEDLIFSPNEGALYLWDATNPATRATEITQAPSKNNAVFITTDRHVVCLGCNDPANDASSAYGLNVRWCDQEDYTNWSANITNTAGSYILSGGTQILAGGQVEGQNIIFTDEAVVSMQFIGPPYTFGFQQVGSASGIISPQSWVSYGGAVYWMGKNAFYAFTGSVLPLNCTVQSYVFRGLTEDQRRKVHVHVDRENHEVTWYYPTQDIESTYLNGAVDETATTIVVATTAGYAGSGFIQIEDERIEYTSKNDTQFLGCVRGSSGTDAVAHVDKSTVIDPSYTQPLEPCRYVTYSTVDNIWWIGRLERTAMFNGGALKYPIGTSRDGNIYEHEFGADSDGNALVAYVESSDFDIGDGDSMMFVRRCIPDFTLVAGSVNLSLRTRYYAQSSQVSESVGNVLPTTEKINTRIRGRQMSIRVESNDIGDDWKYGSPRIDIQPDGRR